LLLFGNNLDAPTIIGIFIAVLMGMTVHEFAHNYVAHLMGDPNPSRQGRLTLDPSVHIYWPGFIMFLLIGFGILGTAPIAAHRMRNPRWGYFAAVAAGPFSNLLLAIVFSIPLRLVDLPTSIAAVGGMIVFWNVLLFVFNLLPFFPIDGWHLVLALLPPDLAIWWDKNKQNSQYVLFGLILLSFMNIQGFNLLGRLIFDPTLRILDVLRVTELIF